MLVTSKDIVCQSCGLINDYAVHEKANNHCAFCNGCGRFIKNIPYKEPSFYVGKYKGRPINTIDDVSYLEWAQRTMKLSAQLRDAINYQLDYLQNLAR